MRSTFLLEVLVLTVSSTVFSDACDLTRLAKDLQKTSKKVRKCIPSKPLDAEASALTLEPLGTLEEDLQTLRARLEPDQPSAQSAQDDFIVKDGDWTVIQRRKDGSENFNRTWNEYKAGFGQPKTGEFWIGMDRLHAMTSSGTYELRIDIESYVGTRVWETYSNFAVDDEASKFRLSPKLSLVGGTAGDSLLSHKGKKFSTYDSDNDSDSSESCSKKYGGGWWFAKCFKLTSSLNGAYPASCRTGECNVDPGRGIIWKTFQGVYKSLKRSQMKIRAVE